MHIDMYTTAFKYLFYWLSLQICRYNWSNYFGLCTIEGVWGNNYTSQCLTCCQKYNMSSKISISKVICKFRSKLLSSHCRKNNDMQFTNVRALVNNVSSWMSTYTVRCMPYLLSITSTVCLFLDYGSEITIPTACFPVLQWYFETIQSSLLFVTKEFIQANSLGSGLKLRLIQ